MKSMLYPKLAWQNLKNNRTTYFPYLLTCSVSVAMYYICLLYTSDAADE